MTIFSTKIMKQNQTPKMKILLYKSINYLMLKNMLPKIIPNKFKTYKKLKKLQKMKKNNRSIRKINLH